MNRINFKKIMLSFFKSLEKDYIFYNEASFQNDLAFFLKWKLNPKRDYRVVVERNIINDTSKRLPKKYVDITIINRKTNEKVYVEVKYPKGKSKRRIMNFKKDLLFLKKLNRIKKTKYCFAIFLTPKENYLNQEELNEIGVITWKKINTNFEKGINEKLYYFVNEIEKS